MHHYHDGSFGGWGFIGSQFADIPDMFGDEQPLDGSPAGRPFLRHITVRLKPDAFQRDEPTRLDLTMQALAEALLIVDDVPAAWRICALNGHAPLAYDLLPLPGWRVSSEIAWELTAALRAQSQVASAEPAFEIG